VLFIHGGLGDLRLWAPEAAALSDRYRCIRFDLRFFGRTESPGMPFSRVDDVIGVLDALRIERAALAGLSFGGGIALDVALEHPERVWALAHVAGAVSGLSVDAYTAEQEEAYDVAVESGDLEAAMAIDFAVWAPLGADETVRELWQATPDVLGVPDGASQASPPNASERLAELETPTLVVAALDPPGFKETGRRLARTVPGAQLAEIDSDHYLTLRKPSRVSALLHEFFTAHAPG
jgi:pimeloyl-ACP methyl ester carboxylesterase